VNDTNNHISGTQVWLDPNPICEHPHYKLMVAILQNNNYLIRIDDQVRGILLGLYHGFLHEYSC
jgi:hypothetical protein